MNTKNNQRRRQSRARIEAVFLELIQERELPRITVSEICKRAQLNRTTFYANYQDVYALADSVRTTLEETMRELYSKEIRSGVSRHDYLRLFRHIAAHPMLYRAYFRLGYDSDVRIVSYDRQLASRYFGDRFIEYHCEFFKGGLTAIIKAWLAGGCRETPEEMMEILRQEYQGRPLIDSPAAPCYDQEDTSRSTGEE